LLKKGIDFMLLKAGVDISRLRPHIRRILDKVQDTVEKVSGTELVITSTYEGTHCARSLHYANLAIDIRARTKKHDIAKELMKVLGPDYFILVEPTHIHISFDKEYR